MVMCFQDSSWLLSVPQVSRMDSADASYVGAGKTTLLNFLSGREISQNLERTGLISVNEKDKDTMKNFS